MKIKGEIHLQYRLNRKNEVNARIFGVPLASLAKNRPREINHNISYSDVPIFIEKALHEIETVGLNTEGLGRISAAKSDIQDVKKKIEEGNFESKVKQNRIG